MTSLEITFSALDLCRIWHCCRKTLGRRAKDAGVSGVKQGRERVYTLTEVKRIEQVGRDRSEPRQDANQSTATTLLDSGLAEQRASEIIRKVRSRAKAKESRQLGTKARLAPAAVPGHVVTLRLSK